MPRFLTHPGCPPFHFNFFSHFFFVFRPPSPRFHRISNGNQERWVGIRSVCSHKHRKEEKKRENSEGSFLSNKQKPRLQIIQNCLSKTQRTTECRREKKTEGMLRRTDALPQHKIRAHRKAGKNKKSPPLNVKPLTKMRHRWQALCAFFVAKSWRG